MQNIPALFSLEGKVALVTGSASGLGAAIAVALAQAGASVATHGNRRPADETAREITALGREAAAFSADLSSTSGPEHLVSQALAKFKKIDILINNAGTIHRDAAVDTSLESFQQVLQVNLTSVFQLSQLVARNLISRDAPRQNRQHRLAAQLPGRHPRPRLRRLQGRRRPAHQGPRQRVGAEEHSGQRHRPGYFATTNTEALQADETRNRQILERIPAGRWGQPSDLAGAAIFLASPAADYVTGTVLTVDGGWMGR